MPAMIGYACAKAASKAAPAPGRTGNSACSTITATSLSGRVGVVRASILTETELTMGRRLVAVHRQVSVVQHGLGGEVSVEAELGDADRSAPLQPMTAGADRSRHVYAKATQLRCQSSWFWLIVATHT